MKLTLQIAAAIVIAGLILTAIKIAAPYVLASWTESKVESAMHAQCERLGIAAEDCRIK